jgi:hypothetical protein
VTEENGRPMDDVTWLLHRHAQVRLPFMDDAPIHALIFVCLPYPPTSLHVYFTIISIDG